MLKKIFLGVAALVTGLVVLATCILAVVNDPTIVVTAPITFAIFFGITYAVVKTFQAIKAKMKGAS